jgi:hypothetical protein
MDFMRFQFLYWIIWLLTIACGIIFIVKFKNSRSALLGGIAFGIFVIMPFLIQLFARIGIYYGYESFSVLFDLIRVGAWVLLLLAFIKLPNIAAPQPWLGQQTAAPGTNRPDLASQQVQSPYTPPAQGQAYAWNNAGGTKLLSKGFFIGSFIAAAAVGLIFSVIAYALVMDYEHEAALPFWFLGFLAMIYAAVVFGILIYRLWISIQPGHPRSTPGKAVGYLFIPFYNFYWVFQAYYGWAQDYNKYVREANIPAPPVSESLALTVSILTIVSCIPFLGILASIANFVCLGIFLSQAIDGANVLMTRPNG